MFNFFNGPSAQNDSGRPINKNTAPSISKKDIVESLRSLKLADSLSSSSKTHVNGISDHRMKTQAMTLYQQHISFLLKVIKSKDKIEDCDELNKKALSDRLAKHLTRAEQLKQILQQHENNNQQKHANIPSRSNNNHINASRAITAASATTRRKVSGHAYSPMLQNPFYPTIKNDMWMSPESLPKVPLNSLSGLDLPKRTINESILLPLKQPKFYTGLRTPPTGVLLYGPPGTGKTMLVKATAYETRRVCMFFNCSSSNLTSKWHGEGEKIISCLFRVARDTGPSIIFLDEIDSLLGRRSGAGSNNGGGSSSESEVGRRLKTEFMIQMDGMNSLSTDTLDSSTPSESTENNNNKTVWVLGCTNVPWDLDDAILRRFTARVYIALPDATTRRNLLMNLLEKNENSITNKQIEKLVNALDGFSCSDICRQVGRQAAFGPLRELNLEGLQHNSSDNSTTMPSENELRPISYHDFKEAISQSTKSVSRGLLQRYKTWGEEQSA